MNQAQWMMDSELGPLFLVASEEGLQGIYFSQKSVPMAAGLAGESPKMKLLAQAEQQLREYFRGERKSFDLPLDLQGTAFQKNVWEALRKLPYGSTCSYREIARQIGNEKAVRAVGSANGKNPVCIIVPCHRVIAADGTIGGYSGGLEIKERLLALEQNQSLQPQH